MTEKTAIALEERRKIVAFIRTERDKYRNAMPTAAPEARDRMASKAGELTTIALYIERGDHLNG